MALKIALLALLILAFIYLVYRASDYYFNKREREDRIDTLQEVRQMARDEAIWADDDPETFDRERFESELQEMGVDVDVAERFADSIESEKDINLELEEH